MRRVWLGGIWLLLAVVPIILVTKGGIGDTKKKDEPSTRLAVGDEAMLALHTGAEPASRFAYLAENGLIDPESIGIQKSIPFTFDTTVEQAFVYVETLLAYGWQVVELNSYPQFIDYYLEKDGIVSRVIILEHCMKIFAGLHQGGVQE